jgi:hypothetical protein
MWCLSQVTTCASLPRTQCLDRTLCSLDNLTKGTSEYMSCLEVLKAVGVNLEVLMWDVRPPAMISHMCLSNF